MLSKVRQTIIQAAGVHPDVPDTHGVKTGAVDCKILVAPAGIMLSHIGWYWLSIVSHVGIPKGKAGLMTEDRVSHVYC